MFDAHVESSAEAENNKELAKHPSASFLQDVFSEVPDTYERVNHVLTLGLDILWRRRNARIAAQGGGTEWVDVCTGTGETAVYLKKLAPEGTRVRGVDFTPEMMAEARKKPAATGIEFIMADIGDLPFEDNSVDLFTMSFATRNVNINRELLIRGFAELYRVLKPGGRYVTVETSQPRNALVRKMFHLYIRLIVKQLGSRISGSLAGYAYLSRTIPKFYGAVELAEIMKEAGFDDVGFRRMMFGASAIHIARKKEA